MCACVCACVRACGFQMPCKRDRHPHPHEHFGPRKAHAERKRGCKLWLLFGERMHSTSGSFHAHLGDRCADAQIRPHHACTSTLKCLRVLVTQICTYVLVDICCIACDIDASIRTRAHAHTRTHTHMSTHAHTRTRAHRTWGHNDMVTLHTANFSGCFTCNQGVPRPP